VEDLRICFAIPARMDSTRVPGKMLIPFNGVPLVRSVFDSVKSWGYDTYVVTDSREIADVIPSNYVAATKKALNGSHRLSMVDWDYDYIINVQGDMLGISFDTVKPLISAILDSMLQRNSFDVATLYTKGASGSDVKLLRTGKDVHWFTRSNIGYGDRHLGVYAYTKETLAKYGQMIDSYPSEDLEQNRLTVLNFKAYETKFTGTEINTEADINSRSL
jgi:3-deoxy-manno-octulosonate cytidylyltransferase (CMP-KDO synthetase)